MLGESQPKLGDLYREEDYKEGRPDRYILVTRVESSENEELVYEDEVVYTVLCLWSLEFAKFDRSDFVWYIRVSEE